MEGIVTWERARTHDNPRPKVNDVATRNYLEKARELMPPPDGFEIYHVSESYPATVNDIVCWECGQWVLAGEQIRDVWFRRTGTSWTDRSCRHIHTDCFRGNHPRRRRAA